MKLHMRSRKSEILHFDRFLSSRSYKLSATKVKKSFLSWHWRMMQKYFKNLTCGFKYDMRNLVNFYPTTQKSQKFFPMGFFCPKNTRFELQKYRGVIFHDAEYWYQIWINFWPCGFKSGMKNWVNFHQSTQKSEKVYFDGLFLSKVYNVLARRFHRNYVSWHWKSDKKFKAKLTHGLTNVLRNFHASSQNSENLQF